MKCPECGLVTFDDLPECPRCKTSFALVRPLAAASLDGARHVLRDDPELRVKLRDRLHRARLDRRKQNENPLAAAPDDDAPDWFVPLPGDGNGTAEAISVSVSAPRGHSEETPIVHSDDLPPDDGVRGGATTADGEIDIEVAGPEPLPRDNDKPQFDGDIPGFTDWREELRERLKRIRARREEERLAEGGDAEEIETGADVDAPEADDAEATDAAADEPEAHEIEADDAEATDAAADEPEADEIEADDAEADAPEADEIEAIDEADEEVAAQTEVVGFGAAIVVPPAAEPDVDIELAEIVAEHDGDFTMEQQAGEIVLDLDEEHVDGAPADATADDVDATEEPEVIVLDEEEVVADSSDEPEEGSDDDLLDDPDTAEEPIDAAAEPDGGDDDFDWGEAETEELEPFAEPDTDDEPGLATGEAIERLDAIFDEAADADSPAEDPAEDPEAADAGDDAADLPAAVMPDLTDALDLTDEDEPTAADSVPELDFDEATPAMPTPALDLDLPEADPEDEQALEWDEEVAEPATEHSSSGPLGERAAAALCDVLVLTAIGAALVGAASSGTGLPFRQILVEEAVSLGIAWAIFVIGYSVFFVGSCGQTIGRMVMRLRVVGTDQFSVGFGRAAIRLAAWVVSALPLLAGMLPAFRDPQRRGLHDRLSRTRVVKA